MRGMLFFNFANSDPLKNNRTFVMKNAKKNNNKIKQNNTRINKNKIKDRPNNNKNVN